MIIIWSELASRDLNSIWEYISGDSQYYAKNYLVGIVNSVDILIDFPVSGRIVPEFRIKNLREIIFENYRIIYKIEKNKIYIVTVTPNCPSTELI